LYYSRSRKAALLLITGAVLFVLAAAARALTGNRQVRGKLTTSAATFAIATVLAAVAVSARVSAPVREQATTIAPLFALYGLINAIVALLVNPWREDRVPDRFPNIVQDAIVIGLFGLAATILVGERLLTTTAVGAVVVGLALQDTLGNLFAGLAIQVEKPFKVGHWVNVAGNDGLVSEITWRATKLRTKAGNLVVVPNSMLARDQITNYSEPTEDVRLEVEVGVAYATPPNRVKHVILGALAGEPLLEASRPAEVLLVDFSSSSITYRVRVWTRHFAADELVRDRVRSLIYYAFRRADITIPFPIRVLMRGSTEARQERVAAEALDRVALFEPLEAAQRAELARGARAGVYAGGEAIVRQGDAGASMFVILAGEAVVTVGTPHGAREVSRLGPGSVFGEMSLLTGERRTATVTASGDCEVIEITADTFRRSILEHPAALERVAAMVASRAAELAAVREAGGAPETAPEPPRSFLARVRRFLRLTNP
jgi:small-conductance mechanosensitive channel